MAFPAVIRKHVDTMIVVMQVYYMCELDILTGGHVNRSYDLHMLISWRNKGITITAFMLEQVFSGGQVT